MAIKSREKLDLRTDAIKERDVRDNFQSLEEFLLEQVLLDGEWKFFEIEIPAADSNFTFAHGFSFVPRDIIPVYEQGDLRYRYKIESFDSTNIYINASGPVRLRAFIGRYSDDRDSRFSNSDFATVLDNEPSEIDGGFANSVYLPVQSADGGAA